MEDGVDTSPEAGGSIAPIGSVMPKWPAEIEIVFSEGRTKIGLMNQQPIVRIVLQDAIENVHAHLLIHDSYPNAAVMTQCMRGALVSAARGRFPGAAAIHNRLLIDEEYLANMSVIVSMAYRMMASLILLVATCSDPNYPKQHQGALQWCGFG